MNLKFRIVPNAMPASQGEAKYLGIIIPNGVRNRALMVKNIIAREHFSESTVNAVLDAAIAETEALCAEGRDVNWGPVKFIAKMHGSFPYEDSAFGDGTASVTVDAEGTNSLRALFADVVPTPMSAEEVAAAIKVHNVMDIATEHFGEIHGTNEFEILGNGVTLDAEGESAKLLDRKTGAVLATAEASSVERGQRATCSFAATEGGIAKGAYVLEVTTFGLVGETTPRVFRKPVTLVEAIPEPEPEPSIAKVTSEAGDGRVRMRKPADIVGTGLGGVTSVKVRYSDGSQGGAKKTEDAGEFTVEPDGTAVHVEEIPAYATIDEDEPIRFILSGEGMDDLESDDVTFLT